MKIKFLQHQGSISRQKKDVTIDIDFAGNISKIFKWLFQQYISIIMKRQCTSETCQNVENHNYSSLEIMIKDTEDVLDIKLFIENKLNSYNLRCKLCQKATSTTNISYNKVISINTYIIQTNVQITLNSVQTEFDDGDKKYILKLMINFIAPTSASGVGHFYTYCFTQNGYYSLNDLNMRQEKVNPDIVFINPVYLMYTTSDRFNS